MSADEKYEGWTNRETWAVALHINNDQGWQESVHEALRETVTPHGVTLPIAFQALDVRQTAIGQAATVIRDNVEEFCDVESLPAGMMGGTDPDALATWASVRDDIGSLWRVNWTELGTSFLEDIAESD